MKIVKWVFKRPLKRHSTQLNSTHFLDVYLIFLSTFYFLIICIFFFLSLLSFWNLWNSDVMVERERERALLELEWDEPLKSMFPNLLVMRERDLKTTKIPLGIYTENRRQIWILYKINTPKEFVNLKPMNIQYWQPEVIFKRIKPINSQILITKFFNMANDLLK